MSFKLDIGCGKNKAKGFIGIDKNMHADVDFLVNIDKDLIPIPNSSVDFIRCIHTLEHCENIIFIMNEFYRVCKNKARIHIQIPYGATPRFVQDPTHRTMFNEFTFPKYLTNNDYVAIFADYGLKANFKIINQCIYGAEFNKLDLFITLEVEKCI